MHTRLLEQHNQSFALIFILQIIHFSRKIHIVVGIPASHMYRGGPVLRPIVTRAVKVSTGGMQFGPVKGFATSIFSQTVLSIRLYM
jgi:uncharacterized membrane protein YdjX (TVP38/TMEM64 family)